MLKRVVTSLGIAIGAAIGYGSMDYIDDREISNDLVIVIMIAFAASLIAQVCEGNRQ